MQILVFYFVNVFKLVHHNKLFSLPTYHSLPHFPFTSFSFIFHPPFLFFTLSLSLLQTRCHQLLNLIIPFSCLLTLLSLCHFVAFSFLAFTHASSCLYTFSSHSFNISTSIQHYSKMHFLMFQHLETNNHCLLNTWTSVIRYFQTSIYAGKYFRLHPHTNKI